jgi:hypothetical protein
VFSFVPKSVLAFSLLCDVLKSTPLLAMQFAEARSRHAVVAVFAGSLEQQFLLLQAAKAAGFAGHLRLTWIKSTFLARSFHVCSLCLAHSI